MPGLNKTPYYYFLVRECGTDLYQDCVWVETEYQERRKYLSWCLSDGVQGSGKKKEGIMKKNKDRKIPGNLSSEASSQSDNWAAIS